MDKKDNDQKPSARLKDVSKKDAQLNALRDQLVRSQAQIDNLKKDLSRRAQEGVWLGIEMTVRALSPAIDELVLALKNAESGPAESFKDGLANLFEKIIANFEMLGVSQIVPGKDYDPKFQEAVENVPGVKKYEITEQVGLGWMWKDGERVIVPAKVKVGGGEAENV